ncbi:MAG: DUF6379 domain-containing protein [Thermofilaceae archaeon]|nr:DUF6379 domain-containing protein [Thermofilaceae archaeon]MDW8004594.1 DUF6379 domain-containing protein [Thermofilaceae archaeon]
MFIPRYLLRQLYVKGSLENVDLNADGSPDGVRLKLRNTLGGGTVRGKLRVKVDGEEVPADKVWLEFKGWKMKASEAADRSFYVSVGDEIVITLELGKGISPGEHKIELELDTQELGPVGFDVTDTVK